MARIQRNALLVFAGELTPRELLDDARAEARRRGWACKSARASRWAGVNAAMRACGWSVSDIQRGGGGRDVDEGDAVGVACDAEKSESEFVEIERSIIGGTRKPLPMISAEDVDPCGCSEDSMCAEGCVNAAMSVRCDARVCACGVCKNASLHHLSVPHLEIRRSKGQRGRGLFAVDAIPADVFCGEYTGEFLTDKQRQRREEKQYMIHLDAKCSIDARHFGNQTRFINHTCGEPNARVVKFEEGASSYQCVGIFSSRNISAGEELTLDYGMDFTAVFECTCGSDRCKSRRQKRSRGAAA